MATPAANGAPNSGPNNGAASSNPGTRSNGAAGKKGLVDGLKSAGRTATVYAALAATAFGANRDAIADLSVEQPDGENPITFNVNSPGAVPTPSIPGKIAHPLNAAAAAAPGALKTPKLADHGARAAAPGANPAAAGQPLVSPAQRLGAQGAKGAGAAPQLPQPLNAASMAGAGGAGGPGTGPEQAAGDQQGEDGQQAGNPDDPGQPGEEGQGAPAQPGEGQPGADAQNAADAGQEDGQQNEGPGQGQPDQPQQAQNGALAPAETAKLAKISVETELKSVESEEFWTTYASIIPSFGLSLLYLNGWWLAGHFVPKWGLTGKQKLAVAAADLVVCLLIVAAIALIAYGICNSPLGYIERTLAFFGGGDSICKPLQSF